MDPTIGRIVHYRLTADDVKRIVDRRNRHVEEIHWRNEHGGDGIRVERAFDGNVPQPGDIVPLLIVRVWPSEYSPHQQVGRAHDSGNVEWHLPASTFGVNGQAFLDGNDALWVTSAPEGDFRGAWSWPPRQ